MLRQDNADRRLTPAGRELGIVNDQRWQRFTEKSELIDKRKDFLNSQWVQPGDDIESYLGQSLNHEYSLSELLRRPKVSVESLLTAVAIDWPDSEVNEQIEIDLKYEGYIKRQLEEVEKINGQHGVIIPESFDYAVVGGLSNEVQQKLTTIRPETIGQASRISGVTPAAISLLLIYLKKNSQLRSRQTG